ncbi:RHS repeat-associated core domain-containing protein [Nonomuraea sp. NPDC005650]|uniref:RHS repeat-associated core domain-containing protein n=1 Tax=Nonomuraea sp. NPDC005650 TaxID=3157045 RepID=UPI0033B76EFF
MQVEPVLRRRRTRRSRSGYLIRRPKSRHAPIALRLAGYTAQRPTDTLSCLILMGVRVYNPSTSRFLQVDAVFGGCANAYDYCSAHPINCRDFHGKAECEWFAVCNFVFTMIEEVLAMACRVRGLAYLVCKALVGDTELFSSSVGSLLITA